MNYGSIRWPRLSAGHYQSGPWSVRKGAKNEWWVFMDGKLWGLWKPVRGWWRYRPFRTLWESVAAVEGARAGVGTIS